MKWGEGAGGTQKGVKVQNQGCKLMQQLQKWRKDEKMDVGSYSAMESSCFQVRAVSISYEGQVKFKVR